VALFDTGTSFLGFPEKIGWIVLGKIRENRKDCEYGQNGYIRCFQPSKKLQGLPTLEFMFGQNTYYLQPEDYAANDAVLGITFLSEDLTGPSVLIMGDTFLKTTYTLFDMDQKRLGLANPPEMLSFTFIHITVSMLAVTLIIGIGFSYVRYKHKNEDALGRLGGIQGQGFRLGENAG